MSLEEQYKPDVDSSIAKSVERGVREELLLVREHSGGLRDYPGEVKVSVRAFQVETLSLLYGFLAVVELPDVTHFEELVERWLKAPDRPENAAIAALRMSPDVLKECLASEGLPQSIRENPEVLERGPGFDAALREEKEGGDPWQWHPTSPARLALALSIVNA